MSHRLLSERFPRAHRGASTRQLHAKLADLSIAHHVLAIGDSNIEGYGTTKDVNRSRAWWSELQRQGRALFDPFGPDDNASYFPTVFGSTPTPDYTSAFVRTGTVTNQHTTGNASGMGLRSVSMAGTANFLTFTGIGTDFEVWYRAGPGQEVMQVTLDTVAGATQSTARAGGVLGGRTFSTGLTGLPYGVHTVKIAPTGTGTIYIEGVKVYNGGIGSGFHVWDCGHGGFTVNNFLTQPTAGSFVDFLNYNDATVGGKLFDYILIELGVNEAFLGSRTAAQYGTDLQALITQCQFSGYTGGFGIVFNPASNGIASPYTTWDAYRSAALGVVNANTLVDFFDLADQMGPTIVGSQNAPLSIVAADQLHFNDRGMAWVARIVGEAILPKTGKVLTGIRGGAAAATDPRLAVFGADACASTAITLSGLQTVNTVALVADQYCLTTAQGFNPNNRIWQVKPGAWIPAPHMPTGLPLPLGSIVSVTQGSTNKGLWQTNNPSGTIVGKDTIFWVRPQVT